MCYIAPPLRVDGRGDIFFSFVSPLSVPVRLSPLVSRSACRLRSWRFLRFAAAARLAWWSSLAIRPSPRFPRVVGRGDRCRIVLAACLLARAFVCGDSVLPVIVRLYRSVMLYI